MLIRTTGTSQGNGHYVELYINGNQEGNHARSVNGNPNGYYLTWEINEIFAFEENTTLQVYLSANGSYNHHYMNQFSITKLN